MAVSCSSSNSITPFLYHPDKWQARLGLVGLRLDGGGADTWRISARLALKSTSICGQRLPGVDAGPKLELCSGARRGTSGGRHVAFAARDKSVQVVHQDAGLIPRRLSVDGGDGDEAFEEDNDDSDASGGGEGWGSTYEKARSLLSSLSKGVNQLETDITSRRNDIGNSARQIESILSAGPSTEAGQAMREAEERVRKLQVMVQGLQRDRAVGEQRLQKLQTDYQRVYQRLKEAEVAASEAEDLRQVVEVQQEEKAELQKQLNLAKGRENDLLSQMKALEDGMGQRDSLLQQLQQEAALSSSALQQAAKAMVAARDRTLRMEEQLEHTGDMLAKESQNTARAREHQIQLQTELTEARQEAEAMKARLEQLAAEVSRKDQLMERTREEAAKTREMLDMTSKSLADARETIEALEQRSESGSAELRQELEASSDALRSAAQREQALRGAEGTIQELSSELATLKEEMVKQGQAMAVMKEETIRNAQMLMAAAQTRKELDIAQKRIGQLTGQVAFLEKEVKSRDTLLMEIRTETRSSTNALQVASRYKQELNEVREREAELQEDLEAKELLLMELRKELKDNLRAHRAEQALRQVELRNRELEEEAHSLRKSMESREEAMAMMQGELNQSAAMLQAAAENRQALKELQGQVEILKRELGTGGDLRAEHYISDIRAPQSMENDYSLEAAAAQAAQNGVQTRGRTAGQWNRSTARRGHGRGYPSRTSHVKGNSNSSL